MPQSLGLVIVHFVFSTKDRFAYLDPAVRPSLHAYLATVARNQGNQCYRVGGVADHVHLAVRLSRAVTVAQFTEGVKTSSSKWLKNQSRDLTPFAWQRGYGAFSVGPADLDALIAYIDRQIRAWGDAPGWYIRGPLARSFAGTGRYPTVTHTNHAIHARPGIFAGRWPLASCRRFGPGALPSTGKTAGLRPRISHVR
jgi:REP element-mobilizing transposase RayT